MGNAYCLMIILIAYLHGHIWGNLTPSVDHLDDGLPLISFDEGFVGNPGLLTNRDARPLDIYEWRTPLHEPGRTRLLFHF